MTIDTTSMRTRRALLAGTLGGAVALVAGALWRPLSGQAADGDVIHVGDDLSGTRVTMITTSAGNGLKGVSEDGGGLGVGVYGWASAKEGATQGVAGESNSPQGIGVSGFNTAKTGTAYGVFAESHSTEGIGVSGSAPAPGGVTNGVRGTSASTEGTGVLGFAVAASGATNGVVGQSASTEGIGVIGLATASGGETYGVFGHSTSTEGRGGWFSGQAAQMKLDPATTVHPASGQMGDLFLDNEGALWLCKGDTDWKQLA